MDVLHPLGTSTFADGLTAAPLGAQGVAVVPSVVPSVVLVLQDAPDMGLIRAVPDCCRSQFRSTADIEALESFDGPARCTLYAVPPRTRDVALATGAISGETESGVTDAKLAGPMIGAPPEAPPLRRLGSPQQNMQQPTPTQRKQKPPTELSTMRAICALWSGGGIGGIDGGDGGGGDGGDGGGVGGGRM